MWYLIIERVKTYHYIGLYPTKCVRHALLKQLVHKVSSQSVKKVSSEKHHFFGLTILIVLLIKIKRQKKRNTLENSKKLLLVKWEDLNVDIAIKTT